MERAGGCGGGGGGKPIRQPSSASGLVVPDGGVSAWDTFTCPEGLTGLREQCGCQDSWVLVLGLPRVISQSFLEMIWGEGR